MGYLWVSCSYRPLLDAMGVNSNVRFGISKSGCYLLDFIPKAQLDRYLQRLNSYNVNYKVVTRESKIAQQEVCSVVFFWIQKELRDKLRAAYGFIDKREYSIPKYKDFICFIMDNHYIIACNKNVSNQIEQMKNYLKQYTNFTYKVIFVEHYAIFVTMINLFDAIYEDIDNFIGIVNEDGGNEQKKEEVLKLRDLIDKYNKDIASSRVQQAIFDFGGCIGYPRAY